MRHRTLLIHGPTASGKTALALACAHRMGAEIVNADSMQIYRDLRILTARPPQSRTDVPRHHLFGYLDGAVRHSVAQWLARARGALLEIEARGRPAIIVGGSGLYLEALIEGLSDVPEIDPAIRAEARRLTAEGRGHDRLRDLDPQGAARVWPGDLQRVSRALEVAMATGVPLGKLHLRTRQPVLEAGSWSGLVLLPPRGVLAGRIEKRFAGMIEDGALAEARALMERGLDPAVPIVKAHGLMHLIAHIRGATSLDEAMNRAVIDTRRYAKRQRTWIAHRLTRWPRITSLDSDRRIDATMRIHDEAGGILD